MQLKRSDRAHTWYARHLLCYTMHISNVPRIATKVAGGVNDRLSMCVSTLHRYLSVVLLFIIKIINKQTSYADITVSNKKRRK